MFFFVRHLVDQTVGLCNISFLSSYRSFEDAREVENSTLSYESRWSRQAGIDNREVNIVIADSLVIIPDGNCDEIVAFDKQSGETKWRDSVSVALGRVVFDEQRNLIYVTKRSIRELVAYRLADGKRQWSNRSYFGERIGMAVQDIISEGQVFLQADTHGIVPINSDDGSYGESLNTIGDPIAYSGDLYISRDSGRMISAIDYPSNEVLWSFSSNSIECCLDEHVVFTAQQVIVRIGGTLYVFDKDTGEVEWLVESPSIASNPFISEDIVFILDSTANLRLLNLSDGTEIGNIQFEVPHDPDEVEGSWIAISDNYVAIYFQDTKILSVMEVSLEDIRN